MTKRTWCGAAAILLALAVPLPAAAQDYPNRPIRVVVPYPPGGQSDIFMRLIADQMKTTLNTPVTVENRAGAGTTLGANVVAKSPADGYTLLLAAASATAITPLTMKNVQFDATQITPITLVAKVPYVLVAAKHFPPNTMQEFIAYAKANPGKLNYGSSGPGSSPHLATELFASMAGFQATHIPYKGVGLYITAQIGNEIQFSFSNMFTTMPHWKSRLIRPCQL